MATLHRHSSPHSPHGSDFVSSAGHSGSRVGDSGGMSTSLPRTDHSPSGRSQLSLTPVYHRPGFLRSFANGADEWDHYAHKADKLGRATVAASIGLGMVGMACGTVGVAMNQDNRGKEAAFAVGGAVAAAAGGIGAAMSHKFYNRKIRHAQGVAAEERHAIQQLDRHYERQANSSAATAATASSSQSLPPSSQLHAPPPSAAHSSPRSFSRSH